MEKRDVIGQYKLPVDVRFCTKCTISNQRPRISFDATGVCSACNFAEYKRKHVDWNEREKQLLELCKQYRKGNGEYDVIVPCSGGNGDKDDENDSGCVIHEGILDTPRLMG